MAKLKIDRQASDNTYLHKDFHSALNTGLEYLETHYSEQAVRDYLRQFTLAWYAPLTKSLREKGLSVLREHYERIFALEGGVAEFHETPDDLQIDVHENPAVTHMRAQKIAISPLFVETVRTVGKTLCENTPFDAELLHYDETTGRYTQRFYRRGL